MREETERGMSKPSLWLRPLYFFSSDFFFSSFSMETSPLKFLTYANTSKAIFIKLSLERRRGSLGSGLEIPV